MKPHGGKKACEQALMRQYMDEDEEPEDCRSRRAGVTLPRVYFLERPFIRRRHE
jgi:hypothetical protein